MQNFESTNCFIFGYGLIALPGWLSFLTIVGTICLISIAGLLISKKLFPSSIISEEHTKFANSILSIIGGLTAFTISFVIVNSWIKYHEQVTRMENEATELSTFYRDSFAYPPERANKLQEYILKYTQDLINEGWPKLINGEECFNCRSDINILYSMILSYEPQNEIEKAALKNNFDHIHALVLYRKHRLLDSQNPIIPDILWYVIITGFFLTMLITYFVHLKKLSLQIILTLIYSLVIGMLIFVALHLNYPYRGVLKIKPFALERLKEDGYKFYPKVFDEARK